MNTDDCTLVRFISQLVLKPRAELAFANNVGQGGGYSDVFRCESDEIVELNMQTENNELKEINKHLQQEIIELKQKEADLEKSVAVLRSILESTACGIVAFSLWEDIVSCNQKFVDMWRLPNSLKLSKNCSQCQAFFENQLTEPQLFRDFMWGAECDFAGDRCDILELKDGRIFVQYSRPQWLDDKIIGRVWSIWDITDYKLPEIEQSKHQSELNSHYISMLCHQLRVPLNVVLFSNSLLKKHIKEWKEEKTRSLLDHIQTAVEQMSKMLDDTLFFGKAETAQLNFNAKPLNLVGFCQELVAQIHSCSHQQRVNFSSQGNCLAVLIDKKFLEPILKNLLDNALKYSPSGVVVDLKLVCEPEQVIFQVVDKGIGIPVVDRKHLFEPFYRGSNIANLPGTGLGLSIVKTLVDLHGGHIDIESEVGIGTTFTVMLPFVKCEV